MVNKNKNCLGFHPLNILQKILKLYVYNYLLEIFIEYIG